MKGQSGSCEETPDAVYSRIDILPTAQLAGVLTCASA